MHLRMSSVKKVAILSRSQQVMLKSMPDKQGFTNRVANLTNIDFNMKIE